MRSHIVRSFHPIAFCLALASLLALILLLQSLSIPASIHPLNSPVVVDWGNGICTVTLGSIGLGGRCGSVPKLIAVDWGNGPCTMMLGGIGLGGRCGIPKTIAVDWGNRLPRV